MGATSVGVTEKEDRERRVDQQHVFHRVTLLLAAITVRLLSRILGAPDTSFSSIVANRGEAGAGVAAGRSAGVEEGGIPPGVNHLGCPPSSVLDNPTKP
jgi:hypothetical protein